MTPPISVLMPVRDGARWLDEAIASLQNQILPDFELIVVDDGSADESPNIMRAHARSDPRIRMIHQERLGLVAALNRGIAESRGQLIARMDADDRAHPQRLQRQSEYLRNHTEVGLLGSWADRIDEQGAVVGSLKPPTGPEQLAPLLMRSNPFVHSSIMLRKAIAQQVGLYRPAFQGAEDYDLWLRMSEVSKIANLPECLLQYRVHPESVSHRARVRQLFSTRLAQRAAQARRAGGHDPAMELTGPPDWQAPESSTSPIYSDLAKLFRLLDLAEASNIGATKGNHLDIAALCDGKVVLNHAERRMAQLALLNMLKTKMSGASRAALLYHIVRLHPPRALRLGLQALRKS